MNGVKSNYARKEQSCRFGSSFAYLHPDQSEEGNKKITNKMKVEIENLEKAFNLDNFKTLGNMATLLPWPCSLASC